jgi:hypothetical protein
VGNSVYNSHCRSQKVTINKVRATAHVVQLSGCQLANFARLLHIHDFSYLAHNLLHAKGEFAYLSLVPTQWRNGSRRERDAGHRRQSNQIFFVIFITLKAIQRSRHLG